MPIATAAVPSSPAHEVARWLLNLLHAGFWEQDELHDIAILRNYEGGEVLLHVAGGELTLSAEVNLADDDDVPLTSIREVRAVPSAPDDPALFELLDIIRYQLAPAYGRQNVTTAVAVLSTPLLEGGAGPVDITETDGGRAATMTFGRGASRHQVFVTGGPPGTAPSVGLLMRSLPLAVAQEAIRLALNADGHAIPAPLRVSADAVRGMLVSANSEEDPAAPAHEASDVLSAPGMAVLLCPEPRPTVWFQRASVETATAVLYACTRKG